MEANLQVMPELKRLFFVSLGIGAGNEARTRDLNLGKVALYQLSYSRKKLSVHYRSLLTKVKDTHPRFSTCGMAFFR